MSDKNKIKLKKLMLEEDSLTTRKVHKIIKDNFNVNYSYQQVRIIVNQLGFHYINEHTRHRKIVL